MHLPGNQRILIRVEQMSLRIAVEIRIYRNVLVSLSYNARYGQFDVDIIWKNDSAQLDYRILGLHGRYSTNFQTDMRFDNGSLNFWYFYRFM